MTYRPGRLKRAVDIDLPHPRDSEVVSSDAFGRYVAEIWHDLREEASRGIAATTNRACARGGEAMTRGTPGRSRVARRARCSAPRRVLVAIALVELADPRGVDQPRSSCRCRRRSSPRSRASSPRRTCCTASGRPRRKCCGRACCSPWSASRSACCSTASGSLRLAFETWVGALAAAPIVLMYPLFLVIFGRSATTIVMIGFAAGLAPVILKTVEGLAGTRRVLIDVGRSFKLTRCAAVLEDPAAGGAAVGVRRPAARPHLRDDQHRRRRVPDQLRRPRPADQRARRALRPARHLRRDLLRHPGERRVLRRRRARSSDGCGRSNDVALRRRRRRDASPRCGVAFIVAVVLAAWEALARVGPAVPRRRAVARRDRPRVGRAARERATSTPTSASRARRDRRRAR